MLEVLKKDCTFECPIDAETAKLRVQLGWDEKEQSLKERIKGRMEAAAMGASSKTFDLNLAAILEFNDGTKPELVFHRSASGCGEDEAGTVLLSNDDRTGFGKGSDETIEIHLADVPFNVERIVLFMNIGSANMFGQHLADVDGVFAQIENADTCAVLMREEDAFKSEEAKEYCAYAFAQVCREEKGWVLRGLSRYSCEDCEHDTLKAFMED